MKIKTRLLLGFVILLVLMAGVAAFGYGRLTGLNDRMNRLQAERFAKVLGVAELRNSVNAAARSVSDLIARAEDGDSTGLAEIKRALADIRTGVQELGQGPVGPEEQMLVDRVSRDAGRYEDFLEQFAGRIGQRDDPAAAELGRGVGRTSRDDLVASLDSLASFERKLMEEEIDQTQRMYAVSVRWFAALTFAGLILGVGVILWVFPSITKGLNLLALMGRKLSQGRLRSFRRLEIAAADELGDLARVFRQIAFDLLEKNEREAQYNRAKEERAWIDVQTARTAELLKDVSDLKAVSQSFLEGFCPVLGAACGAMYLLESDRHGTPGRLRRFGAYAYSGSEQAAGGHDGFDIGEGLVGQCALNGEPIVVDPLPPDFLPIRSGIGEARPRQLYLQPVKAGGRTIGVVELACLTPIGPLQRELLERIGEKFAYIVANIQARNRVEELLRESQSMTEELQAQSEELVSRQEELRRTNEKLEMHADQLKKSEERLQRQQEELEQTNQELTEKTLALEEENRRSERKNREIAAANAELERQAKQLSLASRYKSEFLANMSHELRTPLNSLIILSQFLLDNDEGNLTEKQLDYVSTIHSSGNDLLKMIDEILDLAKVDAGKMDIYAEQTLIEDITADLEHAFRSMAESKGLSFAVTLEPDAPRVLTTDGYRLKQILRNLLANAVKFTSEGSIVLRVRRGAAPEGGTGEGEPSVVFDVEDTGIGIPPDKRDVIFEAFRQADGTTSRKFGGTGLGLTISRELAGLLGGRIELESEPGVGSRFSLLLPVRYPGPGKDAAAEAPELRKADSAEMEADGSPPGSFIAAAAETGAAAEAGADAAGLRPAAEFRLQTAAALAGRTVLLVDDDPRNVFSLSSLLLHHGLGVVTADNGREAMRRLEEGPAIDLVLMDIMMPEMDGFEAIAGIRRDPRWKDLPIIALTAKALPDDRERCLAAGASDYLAKPVVNDRLLAKLGQWLSP